MKPRIVRGYTNGSWPDGPGQWLKEVSGEPDEVWNVPVLLLPDDGTQVVVGREEWEKVVAFVTDQRCVNYVGSDCARANRPAGAWCRRCTLRAILGTNGGGK